MSASRSYMILETHYKATRDLTCAAQVWFYS